MGRSTGGIAANVLRGISRRVGGRARGLVALSIVLLSLPAGQALGANSTLVMFDFGSFGTVQVDMFTQLTPQSVNNFLGRYVSTGRYSNTMVHRVDTGLGVVQGGGFNAQANTIVTVADPMVPLEYSHPNARGTLAMARTTDPNSATSQWYFNKNDNSTTLAPYPDPDGPDGPKVASDGYTVFGQVVGPGMTVIDVIAAVPTFSTSTGNPLGPFTQVPATNYTQQDWNNGVNALPHFVLLQSVSIVKTHASFQNPYNRLDINNTNNVNASDALFVINDLLTNGNRDLIATFGSEGNRTYVDSNGDGKLNAQDVLLVVNALLFGGSASQASLTAEPMATPLAVPEPSSLALAAIATSALLGFGWRKRSAGRRRAA